MYEAISGCGLIVESGHHGTVPYCHVVVLCSLLPRPPPTPPLFEGDLHRVIYLHYTPFEPVCGVQFLHVYTCCKRVEGS